MREKGCVNISETWVSTCRD